ncbi:MAG: uracil-DNA glycosylase family protein [Candidatus Accumulibacter phosphatis]|jgi:single-strand selective monofunctional uracil DNA glycosylase|uniref:Uracil DNA glycosylase superfamily protein n=2 Tax=Candidatus Accumulibacter TaxID=327159 RepID=A0A080M8I3_9PROT|nr:MULTISPECIES: uracil-DNA glycosylase family protein [Candidatus Accumulibacter]KFB73449.1 MAG: Uracil DNA glycosylase superfamily protein [Candidatus Accumulibacter phosphatis]MBL8406384.1 single-strand selective monofunctional uracil-DNA glycosylase [Accumulibacter sp.]NMQ04078.1 single-strand selective monofunctional uracil-DNA glycosylase [Candidatus Accumulibacter contiguus]HRF13292.1 single-strand selective monofunctional uracil-DNA glycosylase [Candidatus Accumulibacter phosphatis]
MERDSPVAATLIAAARQLSASVSTLTFSPPVSHVYNPLSYAWSAHELYLRRYGASTRRVVFLGMNPGPFGMVQCGVPFGEVAAVRDWLGIEAAVLKPAVENPRRPIEGFACARSEVSGRRLWGLFRERFGSADAFFAEHFVANYCPLAFFDQARNLTPDRLPAAAAAALRVACDAHLKTLVSVLQPEWVVGVGAFAETRAAEALAGTQVRTARVLHPSPASPLANQGWAAAATRQLVELGIWE